MPLGGEELAALKRCVDKKYGRFHEKIIAAEYVQIQGKGKPKHRILVVGCHRLYTFRKASSSPSVSVPSRFATLDDLPLFPDPWRLSLLRHVGNVT